MMKGITQMEDYRLEETTHQKSGSRATSERLNSMTGLSSKRQ
jgi:hypothetical protein